MYLIEKELREAVNSSNSASITIRPITKYGFLAQAIEGEELKKILQCPKHKNFASEQEQSEWFEAITDLSRSEIVFIPKISDRYNIWKILYNLPKELDYQISTQPEAFCHPGCLQGYWSDGQKINRDISKIKKEQKQNDIANQLAGYGSRPSWSR